MRSPRGLHPAPCPAPRSLLQRQSSDLHDLDLVSEDEPSDAPEGRLICRVCGHPVTHRSAGVRIAGRHVHRRTNPAGVEFEFGCFGSAPGAGQEGTPTDEHTWFAGYRWRFAVCGACGSHLGWFFEGREPAFWALVTDRLEDADS